MKSILAIATLAALCAVSSNAIAARANAPAVVVIKATNAAEGAQQCRAAQRTMGGKVSCQLVPVVLSPRTGTINIGN